MARKGWLLLLRDSHFSEFEELIIEIGNFFEIGVVNSAYLLEKLKSLALFEFSVNGFYVVLKSGVVCGVLGRVFELFLESGGQLLKLLRGTVVYLLHGGQLSYNHFFIF